MTAIPASLLQRFDSPGPRYTSYPTADRFIEAFGAAEYATALEQRRAAPGLRPLSLYVHIPFCESLCYYCACNKIITKQHQRSGEYLRYLAREIDLNTALLGKDQKVTQLHLGGGTPTFMNDEELSALMHMLRGGFDIAAGAECSIEIDPRTVTRQRLGHIAQLGFNRLSFGVQDFDPEVQKAVHRIQPAEQVFSLLRDARELGFESINADFIYGLPRQTPGTFARTLEQLCELRPDRVALYGYAHLPERFKSQRRIAIEQLPSGSSRVEMLGQAIEALTQAGYVYVGMDHFALPNDSLAVAKRQGCLHRNFQGYTTQPDCDLIGLGVSAIGKVGATYGQNAKTLEEYRDALDQGRLPVSRGLVLNRDDLARRAVIMALMCQGEVQFEAIDLAWLLDFRTYFAAELEELARMEMEGLVTLGENEIRVTERGWFFVRGVAMVFDRYLQASRDRARFSRIL